MSARSDDQGGFGGHGGNWRGIRPTFDNPLTWSISLGRVGGIVVRIHVLFLLFIVIELGRAISPGEDATVARSIGIAGLMMGVLFTIVLLHEFGHCIACRRVGGLADEILMWPLGGLAFCAPPNHWKAHLVTVVGGPAVNVVICLVTGATLGVLTGRWLGVALPSPLGPEGLVVPTITASWWLMTLYLINWLSLVLLLFNLLPLFPLDGGRIVQALAWPKLGYVRSMRLAVRTGYVGALALFVFAAISGMWLLCGVAVFGGITCYQTYRQLAYAEEVMGFQYDEYALNLDREMAASARKQSASEQRRAAKQAEKDRKDAVELDRILKKIAERGMDSLSRGEKRWLSRQSREKRGGAA